MNFDAFNISLHRLHDLFEHKKIRPAFSNESDAEHETASTQKFFGTPPNRPMVQS